MIKKCKKSSLCFRIDDIHPQMDWAKFTKFMTLMDEYGIHPLLGIIPNCMDRSICKNKAQIDFWESMREYQNKGYPIAMHGYDHVYITKEMGIFPINNYSEFAGLDGRIQEEKIAKGKEKLEKEGIHANVFMAPAHSFDNITVDILSNYGFSYVTDGFSRMPYKRKNMIFIPITLNIRAVEKKRLHNSISTIVVHTDTMDDMLFGRYKDICEMQKRNLVSYEEVMALEPSAYDAGYEKRKVANYHRMKGLYGAAKKMFKRIMRR